MKKKIVFALIFLSLLVAANISLAATSTPVQVNVNLPGPYKVAEKGPVAIIANIYYFALAGSGLLAFGVIVYAGIKWTASRGNTGDINDAKDMIQSALWGLVLLASAFVLMNTINPELAIMRIPELSPLPVSSSTIGGGGGLATSTQEYSCFSAAGAAGDTCYTDSACEGACAGGETCRQDAECTANSTSTCSVAPLTPIDQFGPQTAAMEGGQRVIWDSSDPNASQNLAALQTEFNKLQNVASSNGFSVTVNSAYRPLGYQKHFYEIKQRGTQLEALTGDAATACNDLKQTVDAEKAKHTICVGVSYSACQVSNPSGCSPHVMGKGIDLTVSKTGLSGDAPYAALDSLLQSNGVKLRWQQVSGDKYHFNLTNPPAGCASS